MTDNLAEKSPTKRIYRSPELRVYGDIHRITEMNPSNHGFGDAPKGKGTKTG